MMNIMIIEDDPIVANTMEIGLNENSILGNKIKTTTCGTITDGLSKMRIGSYDVLILDLKLPDSSVSLTIDWIAKIRELFPETFVIAVSGFSDKDTEGEVLKNGAKFFISKPLADIEVLVNCITAVKFLKSSFKTAMDGINDIKKMMTVV